MSSALNSTTVSITNGNTRSFHVSSTIAGFLKTDGNWDEYVNNSGQIWTANYGWLHDYFFSGITNCATHAPITGQNIANCVDNCTYFGDNVGSVLSTQLVDNGSSLRVRTVRHFVNCACACTCK